PLARGDRGPQTLVGERRRHPDVDHGGLRQRVLERPLQVGEFVDGGDHLEALDLEQLGEAGPQERVVLGDDDAHGTSHLTTVGPPWGLEIETVPSNAASRATTPLRPVPSSTLAPPRPSSPTRPRITARSCLRLIHDRVAWACLAELARHSATAK